MSRPEVTGGETLHVGRRVTLRRDRLVSGSGHEFVREVVEHPGAAVVVPVLPDGRIVFVRQYRHAVGEFLIELPAGTLEPGEDPAVCAARELEEETGWRAGKLEPLGIVYPSPGILSEVMSIYVATELTPGETKRDPGTEEDMELVTLAPEEARDAGIRDAKTLAGLWLAFPKR
jgi:ADP-ribose pyrophosphatase